MSMNTTIDITKLGFSLRNALALAYMSKRAYDDPPTIHDDVTDTNVLIVEQPEAVIVAFRGTASLRNMLTDLKVRRIKQRIANWETEIHQGFWNAEDSVHRQIAAALDHCPMDKPIYRCGHSLGGAVATLNRTWTPYARAAKGFVYTYGEPRGGNRAYAGVCDELCGPLHYRMENDIDSITRIPGWLMGNRHSGQNIFLDTWGSLDINPSRWLKAASDLYHLWKARSTGPMELLQLERDHHIDHYIARLELAVKQYPDL